MPAGVLTLERVPIHKQIYCRALLETGASLDKVSAECEIGKHTALAIKRNTTYSTVILEKVKAALPTAFYALAGLAMSKVNVEKLDACSAPQLMMVAGVAVDKARDMEGSNKPVFNVVTVINECKTTRDKLENQLLQLQSISCA